MAEIGAAMPTSFKTTCWSVVLAAGKVGNKAERALSTLCQIYWRPVLAFVCYNGNSPSDAQDLTQDFFIHIVHGEFFPQADPGRGPFRSFLLKSLQNFLLDAHDRGNTRKRGSDFEFVSWDSWIAQKSSRISLPPTMMEWPAERLYDVHWATTLVERAMRQLREECERCGKRRVFDLISPLLGAERSIACYPELARRLGVSDSMAKNLLHKTRVRYRHLLRKAVAETVASPVEIDDEIRYLCSALTSARS